MTRLIAILAILHGGACMTVMNWRFSYQLGTSAWDGNTWAIFSVALDVPAQLSKEFCACYAATEARLSNTP